MTVPSTYNDVMVRDTNKSIKSDKIFLKDILSVSMQSVKICAFFLIQQITVENKEIIKDAALNVFTLVVYNS